MKIDFFNRVYQRMVERRTAHSFAILASFEITFVVARLAAHLQQGKASINQIGGLHIHHLVPGIFLLLISGYLAITFYHQIKVSLAAAVMFGVGAALTLDEFALWLHLRDVYWESEGRTSLDLIIVASVFLLISYIVSEAHQHNWFRRFIRKLL